MIVTIKREGRKWEKIRGVKSIITGKYKSEPGKPDGEFYSVLTGYNSGEEIMVRPEDLIFVETNSRGL